MLKAGFRFLLLGFLLAVAPAFAVTQEITTSADAKALKALFVGNSLTFYYSLPNTLATFIQAGAKRPTRISNVIVGGYTLREHWNEGNAQKQIAGGGPWDLVVLQGQSRESFENTKDFVEHGRKFGEVIQKAHAKPVLYQTYALKGVNADQNKIHASYDLLGREMRAQVIPVGDVFFYVQKNAPQINLYDPDNKHPSKEGVYLSGLVFYEYLLNKSPIGLPAEIPAPAAAEQKGYSIDANTARRLQELAWKFYVVERGSK